MEGDGDRDLHFDGLVALHARAKAPLRNCLDGLLIETKAEGWNPNEWRAVAERLTVLMDWRRPQIPTANDPVPFGGTPALG